jgi:hypothetical protein
MLLIKRFTSRTVALAAASLAIFTLASCGSDRGTTDESLSKAEFIKQADQICSKTEKRQLALVSAFEEKKQAGGGGSPEEELVLAAGLPPVKEQLQELAELPLPESGSGEVKSYLGALEDGVAAVEANPSLLLSVDSDPFAGAESEAKKVGFKVCRGA